MTTLTVLAGNGEMIPEDVGKAGPLGLLLIGLLLIAVILLVRSMSKHLKKVPRSFDAEDRVEVPDTPAELIDEPRPGRDDGTDVLDALRRAPLAIEPPRREDDGGSSDPGSRD
jgi:hypothetical protein